MGVRAGLNATHFHYSTMRRDAFFEKILTKCVEVYDLIRSSEIQLPNDENTIRDEFMKYFKSSDFKRNNELAYLMFDSETREKSGRADIRILSTKGEYVNDDAYYLIECKRLDSKNTSGTTGLNAEYIKNGICRFVSGLYTSYYSCNAMFGFVVGKVNIQRNIIDNINAMLNKDFYNAQKEKVNANVTEKLQYEDFANGYDYSYVSKHKYAHDDGKELTLYHLMFDFLGNTL